MDAGEKVTEAQKEALAGFDLDGDGEVSKEEMQTVLRAHCHTGSTNSTTGGRMNLCPKAPRSYFRNWWDFTKPFTNSLWQNFSIFLNLVTLIIKDGKKI